MSDIALLRDMIKDNVKMQIVNDKYDKKKQVILTETKGSEYSATINGMPDNAIVIKADAFKSPDTFFNGSKGECKRSDYVIIADTDSKKVIICIEMKAGEGNTEKKIIQQLKGSKCFVAYCQEIGKAFWNNKNFLNDYVYRFVSIKNISISKQPSRLKIKVHDTPDKMLKISSPHYLEFRHLI